MHCDNTWPLQEHMGRVVLYEDETSSIFVIDLPASIEASQGPHARRISSIAPISTSYQTPEPKGAKREILLAKILPDERLYHETLRDAIAHALCTVAADMTDQAWCFPRHCAAFPSDTLAPKDVEAVDEIPYTPPLILSREGNEFQRISDLQRNIICNPSSGPCRLVCLRSNESFFVPANVTFFLGSIQDGLTAMSSAVHTLIKGSHSTQQQGSFDLILLDPPWSNRSVRRSKSYWTAEDQDSDVFGQTMPFIQQHLRHDGRVAIWITNKASIRADVMQMLGCLDLVLQEEWIWCKVTTNGQPVTPLDGIWRKPYEVLLLFRKHRLRDSPVHRRFIFAVPDVHSRKPNLRWLFERQLPSRYVAIELFARSLTQGWWSWGDEVLKFQDTRLWQSEVDR